ncbi:MAG: flagellar basal body P-ring formation chaperone FlgA [Moraxellaceae bacterium]|nr:flagellar basal body P-ring formation chaperone FlgA [Moraxellaceae bacterium]MDZ4387047.1 flagellar basal body P-ring formation chaperone FlgA [Moraxellaceae bacterium]
MHIIKTTVVSVICSLLAFTTAQAGTQSLVSISAAAEDLVRQQHPWQGMDVEIRSRALDPRTRLADCDQPLDTYLPHHSRIRANTTVAVRCQGQVNWQIFVPVNTQVYAPVLVAKHAIARGQVLQADHVVTERRDIAALPHGYLSHIDNAKPQRLRFAVAMGAVISPSTLEPDAAISRGQQVRLVNTRGHFNISMTGIALKEGAIGSRIQVRNNSSGRIIEGIVTSAETVAIN